MFIRQATPTIVIGYNQNPWLECNVVHIKQDGVDIMRRHTGGGTVYLDTGNLLVGFINKNGNSDVIQSQINNKIITDSIKEICDDTCVASSSGRNDLIMTKTDMFGYQESKKIAGSAFKMLNYNNESYNMHHLCILVNGNLEKLSYYLTPSKKKLESKGITSVVVRVSNLSSYVSPWLQDNLMMTLKNNLIRNFIGNDSCKIINITEKEMLSIPDVCSEYERINTDEYIYGMAPHFTHTIEHKFTWGLVNVGLVVKGAKITKVNVFSDSLYIDFVEPVCSILKGSAYNKQSVLNSYLKFKQDNAHTGPIIHELITYVSTQIE